MTYAKGLNGCNHHDNVCGDYGSVQSPEIVHDVNADAEYAYDHEYKFRNQAKPEYLARVEYEYRDAEYEYDGAKKTSYLYSGRRTVLVLLTRIAALMMESIFDHDRLDV